MNAAVSEGARATRTRFYLWIAIVCALVAFIGFAPTYWLKLAQGTFTAAPLVHLHGAIFFGWTLFFIWQAQLVASGQTAHHRETGLIGVSLATAMVIFGFATAIHAVMPATGTQYEHAAHAFILVPISDMILFGALVAYAVSQVRRPETHKRLLLVATVSILPAPVARWFMTFLAPPPPPGPRLPPPIEITVAPALVADLVLVAAIIYDWRTRGRPHPVYLIGLAGLVALTILRVPFSHTPLWQGIADWLVSIAA